MKHAWLLVSLLLVAGAMSLMVEQTGLNDGQSPMATQGRQMEDVNCSGMTFEDLFAYNNATFVIEFDASWSGAAVSATARAADGFASDIRTDLDGLFDGFPGGNDSWISTDERDAVREVGPSCISDMSTRIAIHEGMAVRESNAEAHEVRFVEDGIGLDEVNLIPSDHPELRTCPRPFASSSCREVPVSATQALEIDLFVAEDKTTNAAFDRFEDPDTTPFTIAIVTTNMTNATMKMSFPALAGLTLASWADHDDGVNRTVANPPETSTTSDGRLTVDLTLDYPTGSWPMERVMYLDFTTQSLASNDPPEWLSGAPMNGTRFSLPAGQDQASISANAAGLWGFDQHGWSLACTGENGWSMTQNQLGEVHMVRGDGFQGDLQCSLVDGYGTPSVDNRSWTLLQPFTYAANLTEERHVTVEVQPAAEDGFTLASSLLQGERSTDIISLPVFGGGVYDHSTEGLLPGEVSWSTRISGNGWWPMEFVLDLDVTLPNSDPVLTVTRGLDGTNGTWNALGTSFLVYGEVSDPEGESLTVQWRLCGAGDNAVVTGGAWEAEIRTIACDQQGIDVYVVDLTATDASGGSMLLTVSVEPNQESPTNLLPPAEPEPQPPRGFLPHPGLLASLTVVLFAAAIRRPPEPENEPAA